MDDKHRIPLAIAIGLAWLAATFFTLRIIIPGLINLHNDGAIVFALVIVAGWLYGSYLTYRYTEDFLNA